MYIKFDFIVDFEGCCVSLSDELGAHYTYTWGFLCNEKNASSLFFYINNGSPEVVINPQRVITGPCSVSQL